MSNIDKQALRDIASAAVSTPLWHAVGIFGEVVDPAKPEWKPVHDFCKTFTAERVLALLDELEAKDNRINRLEAIVTVAEQRNALMREWKRVLRVPCDLIDDQVPVVIHSMVIRLERLKEAEAKLEAAEKRIAELSHHLQSAHAFIEHTEAFGYEASNGILCCGDAQWNIDASKSALAAADKGEAS
ncbi:TPA: ead/Ea22-like family protein [Enterobacter hormaechei subsp. xiangfangensis]|uniref:ead/Ea22-like family protein n=1 Tax=Enterobacter hormaechei TaxID=158836 RepID=UPI00101CBFBE|nr:ead/Ea22-like family protein [Enterobacter hormaechei]RYH56519.1 ead/Ea22-like family protein [Enterobacter hormaechei]